LFFSIAAGHRIDLVFLDSGFETLAQLAKAEGRFDDLGPGIGRRVLRDSRRDATHDGDGRRQQDHPHISIPAHAILPYPIFMMRRKLITSRSDMAAHVTEM
jgi:hypothetical protein